MVTQRSNRLANRVSNKSTFEICLKHHLPYLQASFSPSAIKTLSHSISALFQKRRRGISSTSGTSRSAQVTTTIIMHSWIRKLMETSGICEVTFGREDATAVLRKYHISAVHREECIYRKRIAICSVVVHCTTHGPARSSFVLMTPRCPCQSV